MVLALTVGGVSMLEHAPTQVKARFLANIPSCLDGYEPQGHFLKHTVAVGSFVCDLDLDGGYVRSVLDISDMDQAEAVGGINSSNTWRKPIGHVQPQRLFAPQLDCASACARRDTVLRSQHKK